MTLIISGYYFIIYEPYQEDLSTLKTAKLNELHDLYKGALASSPNEIMLEEKINKAFKTLLKVSADDEVREIYRLRELTERNRVSEQTVAREQGRAEGLVEGEKKAKLESAKRFLSMGLSIEQVASGTGLSIEEVEKLKS